MYERSSIMALALGIMFSSKQLRELPTVVDVAL